jgi:hypothetical protein
MLILPVVPTYLAAIDDVFAVQADVFVTSGSAVDEGAAIVAFGDPDPNPANACAALSQGIFDFAWALIGGTAEARWAKTDGCPPSGTGFSVVSTNSVTPFSGNWATLRLEGIKSACRFRMLVDGAVVSTWTGACAMGGDSIVLYGRSGSIGSSGFDIAWSNLRIQKGSGTICVPYPP